jgi:putative Mg2+ transporter-C (MgtC) family protein
MPAIDFLSAYWSHDELATNAVILLNLMGALALGLMVGYERSYHGRAAGMRTYGLVCMASAALTVIGGYPGHWFGGHVSQYLINSDPTRIVQGIVTGIGFLGAGAIIKDREEAEVQGLTTAASVWMTAAIGIACGMGRESTALLSTLLTLMVLAVVPKWTGRDKH